MLSPEPGSLHIWVELAVCGEHLERCLAREPLATPAPFSLLLRVCGFL